MCYSYDFSIIRLVNMANRSEFAFKQCLYSVPMKCYYLVKQYLIGLSAEVN